MLLKAANTGILFHFHPNRAGKGFRKDKSDEGRGNGHEEEDGQNNCFADANDPPVVQEMELGFRRVK